MKLTKDQQLALLRKWQQCQQTTRGLDGKLHTTFLAFRRSCQTAFGGDGMIMVYWCGMWLGIEKDGYTHS
jgi:hypothetical protein